METPAPQASPYVTASRSESERGAVTAETAVVLPVLLAVTVGLVWLVSLGAAQVRAVDAARETARAVARDESPARAVELGRAVAPKDSRFGVADHGSTVAVTVEAAVHGPGGLFDFLPQVEVRARAVSAKEPR